MPTVDGECESSSQTGKSKCTSVRQCALCKLQSQRGKQNTFLSSPLGFVHFLQRLFCSAASGHTEEILRTPPPSPSCTEDESTVLSPAGSRLSQTRVPSKPCREAQGALGTRLCQRRRAGLRGQRRVWGKTAFWSSLNFTSLQNLWKSRSKRSSNRKVWPGANRTEKHF